MGFFTRFVNHLPFMSKPVSVREELTDLIETSITSTDTDFDNQESLLLKNMLGLRDLTAEDVMIPRADITSIDIRDGYESALEQMSKAAHSRFPAHEGSIDEAMGMLHIKDLMRLGLSRKKGQLKSLIRPVLFVSPSLRLLDLLQEMRLKRMHLALVVDEFGGIDGLITIEDLVEEIVGEIQDEHDQDKQPALDIMEDGSIVADARYELEAFEELYGQPVLSEEDRDEIDTVGGLVVMLAGHVPHRGEVISHSDGLEFEILDSDPRRITLLRVTGMPKKDLSPSEQTDKAGLNAPLSLT